MFDGKVIYEKNFDSVDEMFKKFIMGDAEMENDGSGPVDTEDSPAIYEGIVEEEDYLDYMEEKNISYEKAVAEITKNYTYIPMEHRHTSTDDFITLAIHASEEAMMSLKIVQGKYSTEAVFRVDWCQELLPLKPLFAMADDFRFMPQEDDGLSMNIIFAYYTHIVLNRGKLLRPEF